MYDKMLSALKYDVLHFQSVIYPLTVGPVMFYSCFHIPMMNQRIGLTMMLVISVTTLITVLWFWVQRRASRGMRAYLLQSDEQRSFDSGIRNKAYRYPIPCVVFIIAAWLLFPNIFLYVPILVIVDGTTFELILMNLLSLSAAFASAPLAYFLAEGTATKFLDLDISRKIPEPADPHTISVTTKIIGVCFSIIASIVLNVLAATLLGQEYHLTPEQNLFNMLLIIAQSLLVTSVLSILFAQSFSKPLNKIADALKGIATGKGDLTQRLGANTSDAIGDIARHFNLFVTSLQQMVQSIHQSATAVAASSSQLSATSTQIAANTKEVSIQSNSVASATEQATANINAISAAAEEMSSSANTVATAVEEMSVSLNEVSRNCLGEAQLARDASKHATSSREIMDKLDGSARSIGKIVEVINGIADQINLLALNATIEAASAGERGKGFAVVANEVKELAKQSAQATKEIEQKIAEMQANALSAVDSLNVVTKTIENVDSTSQTIVTTVEEQSATVNEISRNIAGVSTTAKEVARNVSESAKGLNEVSASATGVNAAVSDTSRNIAQVKTSADELAKLAENLQFLIGRFKM